jgi:hypothetical protein
MSYPGNPQGEQQPNQGYSYPAPGSGDAYPAPPVEQQYNTQPVSPGYAQPMPPVQPVSPAFGQPTQMQPPVSPAAYGQPVPPQPQPIHDQNAFAGSTQSMPAYGEPTSGYAYGTEHPMSGPPVSPSPITGAPIVYGPPLPPSQESKRGPIVPILASCLALAVVLAGVFIGLYFDKSSKLDAANKTSAERLNGWNTTKTDLDKTKKDLEAKQDELDQAEQDLRGTKNDGDQAKKERDTIASCLKLLTEALAAANAGNKTLMNQKITEMQAPCNQAYAIMGI